jgi:surface antigen
MRHTRDGGPLSYNTPARGFLKSSAIAASLAVFCLSTSFHPAAAARDSEDKAASRKPTHGIVVYRPGTNTFAANGTSTRVRGVMFRQSADNTPVGRMVSGWRMTANTRYHGYSVRQSSLQCVPFARENSGIEIVGNAVNWWDAAAGVYERGNRPEPGAVLNFRANGNMRLGHVAVVKRVINPREIEIDHANWSYAERGNIARNVSVVDVSERNDWTAVRVELARSGDYGNVYPTYGFIYDRPDRETVMATSRSSRDGHGYEEVAEAPDRSLR